MRALLIEDSPKMARGIRAGLEDAGFATEVCHSGADGTSRAASDQFDVILLDLLLPDRDGFDVCRALRKQKVSTPIIMLTALAATEDKIRGLDAGADDYLPKPFRFDELVARIRAVLRRGQASEGSVLRCDNLELNLHARRATRADKHWNLSTREFTLLEYLMRNQNRVLSRAQIGERVWELTFEPASNVIEVYISVLRKKIDLPGHKPLIHTVKHAGYRFGVMD